MTPQHVSVGAGFALAAAAPAVPGSVLFLVACYGTGAIVGQILALALGVQHRNVKEGRVAAAAGLAGLVLGLLALLLNGLS